MATDCTITGDGAHFFLHVPSTSSLGGHTIKIAVDETRLLMRILLKRQQVQNDEKIGTEASPTQQMIDAFISAHGITTKTILQGRQTAAACGLDFPDLEIEL